VERFNIENGISLNCQQRIGVADFLPEDFRSGSHNNIESLATITEGSSWI